MIYFLIVFLTFHFIMQIMIILIESTVKMLIYYYYVKTYLINVYYFIC